MNDDRISELYKGEIWSEALQQRAQRRIHWLCAQAIGDVVLDVGCSQGIASILLAREGFQVTGIDIQPSRIEYAIADLEQEPQEVRERVRFEVANGADLAFDDDTFDTVLLGEVIEHLAVPERLLREVHRVLRPGGRVVITTPFGLSPHHDHKQPFYPDGVVSLISDSFLPISIEVVDRYFRIVGEKPGGGEASEPVGVTDLLGLLDGLIERLDNEQAEDRREISKLREARDSLKRDLVEKSREAVDLKKAKVEEARLRASAERASTESARRLMEEKRARGESEAEVEELKAEVEELKAEVEELKAVLDTEVRTRRRLVAQHRSAASAQASKEQALRMRISRLEQDRWKLRSRLSIAEWKLKSLMARKWWRMGVAIGMVRSNPFRIFVLPFDLISILFSRSALPSRPQPVPRPIPYRRPEKTQASQAAGTASDSSGPDAKKARREFEVPVVERAEVHPSRDLLVATLLDEFSYDLFEHEFKAVQVTPGDWRSVLARGPDLLLVESAWRGKDDTWMGHMAKEAGPSKEFREMVEAFSAAGIPTVFWNKEDPPNYHLYIETAKLFDTVFTVCEESIPDYVRDLGHDRVYLLPFSVQPKIHNPVAVGKRINGVAFAGTYYAKKHPERVAQVEAVLDPAREFPLSIFSRVASSGNYKWPERFEPFIVGSLSYADVLTAYKMFDVFLNVNSVVDSESMCARRIFELAASGTPILSGVSPAIERYFGDIVLQAEDADAGRVALRALLGSEEMRSRIALLGVRTAMREHTVSRRVDEILDRVGVPASRTSAPAPVSLVVPTNRPGQIGEILENVGRQTYPNLQLVIAAHGFEFDDDDLRRRAAESGVENVTFVPVDRARTLGEVVNAGFSAADGDYIGKIDDDNYYGPEFVGDLMDAFGYTEANIVGKWSHYTYVEGMDALVLRFPGFEHTYVELVAGSAMIVERAVFDSVQFPSRRVGEDTQFLRDAKTAGVRTYSADRYNYVYMRYSSAGHHTFNVPDVELAAKGELVQYGLNLAHVTV